MNGLVFDIQRCSFQDGPGIRTTVFLKGCPLSCNWCHNPESISNKPELGHIETKCIFCTTCVHKCPFGAITADKDMKKWSIDRSKCNGCSLCLKSCLTEALTIAGKEMSVNEIVDEVIKDEIYFKESGGGLTVSGGEPMLQFEFLSGLLKAAKEKGIQTSIETSGMAPQYKFKKILPLVDIFLFDYKVTGNEKHLELTGVNNKLILKNLQYLLQKGAFIEIRCPLIPGINDSPEHLKAIADLEKTYPKVSSIRILPYHNTGNSKYTRYGITNKMPELTTTPEETKMKWKDYFIRNNCKKVFIE